MSTNDAIERTVADWFHADAEHRVPDHLDAVLGLTSAARQRPAWSIPERWLPMDTAYRATAVMRPAYGRMLLIALLIAAMVGAIVVVGSRQHHLPAPFGPAQLGLVAYASGGDIYLRDPASSDVQRVTSGDDYDSNPAFSPDGTRFGFLRRTSPASQYSVVMMGKPDGSGMRRVSDPIYDITSGDWSGDGRYLAVSASDTSTFGGDDHLIAIVDLDHAMTRTMDVGVNVESVRWMPPLGQDLMFRGVDGVLPDAVWTVRADGTGLRPLTLRDGVPGEAYQNPSISPDGRLLGYHSWSRPDLKMHVYLRDVRDGSIKTIPNPVARSDLFMEQFSPDGRLVAFTNQRRDSDPPEFGGVVQVGVAPVDGSDVTFIGPEFPFDSVPTRPDLAVTFTVDGAAVLLLDHGKKQIWTLPVDGRPGRVEPWDGEALPGMQRVAYGRHGSGAGCFDGGCR